MNRRFYIFLAILALVGWGIVTVLRQDLGSGPEVGSPAPGFTLPNLNGEEISLESFRGKAVLMNFWATWCGPCRHEMPSLEALYQKYKDRGFVVLGVSVDDEGWEPIRGFLKAVPVSFPIVLDKEQKVTETYETFRIPETYLINPKGEIAGKIVGPQDYSQEVFFKKIERILPKAP